MNAQASGRSRKSKPAGSGGRKQPEPAALPKGGTSPKGSATQLEAQIAARREHLAATIDELAARAAPKEIARRTTVGLREKLRSLTHTPDGDLRTERLAAVGGAVVVLAGVLTVLRRRRG